MSIQVDQKSTIVADMFTLPPSLTGLLDIQVFCPDDGIQFWVVLHPAVIMLVVALLVLAGCSRARKVVVILFGIEVHGAVGVLAEAPVHIVLSQQARDMLLASAATMASLWIFGIMVATCYAIMK
jgi:hypothetical protein